MLYTVDGKLEIDNNLIENAIRPVAIGRKNYLFAGSHNGARRAAMLYSFLGTCKINDVNPFEWLRDVLSKNPSCARQQSKRSVTAQGVLYRRLTSEQPTRRLKKSYSTKNCRHSWRVKRLLRKKKMDF
jgi:hypothetical protein